MPAGKDQTSHKPRKHYRAPDSVVRSVRLVTDAYNRPKGKRTGAVKLWAYGYEHLAAVFGISEESLRQSVKIGKMQPGSLASIIEFAIERRGLVPRSELQ